MNPHPSLAANSESSAWPPEVLNYAIQELRNEYAKILPERIVNAVGYAARTVRPELGRVALHQRARDRLRSELTGSTNPLGAA